MPQTLTFADEGRFSELQNGFRDAIVSVNNAVRRSLSHDMTCRCRQPWIYVTEFSRHSVVRYAREVPDGGLLNAADEQTVSINDGTTRLNSRKK